MPDHNVLLSSWNRLRARPFGPWIFSKVLGRRARYTGSIRPLVRELAPGRARVLMRDRPAVRNHLNSIHAIALINLGEVTGGIALLAALPNDRRGIVTQLSMTYKKKARGTLEGRADFTPPEAGFEGPFITMTELVDQDGDVVAIATAEWTIGPARR